MTSPECRDPRFGAVMTSPDPRIHFALNCASKSCPPIGVYTPDQIDDQLDLAAQNFIQQDLKIIPDRNMISISKIFQWYLVDFGGKHAIPGFLIPYLVDGEDIGWLEENQNNLKIRFHTYNWGLNRTTL